jgi:hypothetical protein
MPCMPCALPPSDDLHVLPHERSGAWLVGLEQRNAAPLSWHATAGEAESAARSHASARGARNIFLHDRYQRVRSVALTRS